MKRGDIILVKYPFTDLQFTKTRPALIISDGLIGNDVVVMAITKHEPREHILETDIPIMTNEADFLVTKLKMSSTIRCHRLVALEKSLILGILGKITPTVLKRVQVTISNLIGLHDKI